MQKERKFAKKDSPEFEETAAETDAVKFASGKQNPKKQKRTRSGGKKKNKKKYTDKMNPFPSSSQSCLSAEELVCLEDSSLSNGKEETVLLNCSVEKNAENTKDLKPLSDCSGEEEHEDTCSASSCSEVLPSKKTSQERTLYTRREQVDNERDLCELFAPVHPYETEEEANGNRKSEPVSLEVSSWGYTFNDVKSMGNKNLDLSEAQKSGDTMQANINSIA